MPITRRKFVIGSVFSLLPELSSGYLLAPSSRNTLAQYHDLFNDKEAAMRLGQFCAASVPRDTMNRAMREVKHALLSYESTIPQSSMLTRRLIVSAAIKKDFYEANTISINNLKLSATEVVLFYSFYFLSIRI